MESYLFNTVKQFPESLGKTFRPVDIKELLLSPVRPFRLIRQDGENNSAKTGDLAMNIRFITQKIHALLDYPVAISLMVMPFVLGLGQSNPLALWLSVATGVAAFILTLLTNHETGVFRVLPYSVHLAVDFAVGVVFVIAPFAFGFTGMDAMFYWANAAAVLTVVSLHQSASVATSVVAEA